MSPYNQAMLGTLGATTGGLLGGMFGGPLGAAGGAAAGGMAGKYFSSGTQRPATMLELQQQAEQKYGVPMPKGMKRFQYDQDSKLAALFGFRRPR
jgi:uncharacterized protein YcfJ